MVPTTRTVVELLSPWPGRVGPSPGYRTGVVITFVFGSALLVAVLTSSLASRSPLSTSAVFLVAGLLAGPLALDLFQATDEVVEWAAELALFAILFTDGQHAPWRRVRAHFGPPARALLIAMPLSVLLVALLGRYLLSLSWSVALVLGAVLAPTDPVFASALVGREDVPARVRNLLNVESGLNDGLALPAVLVLAGVAGAQPEGFSTDPAMLVVELAGGALLGVALPTVVWVLLRLPGVGSVPALRPLGPLAVGVLLFGACEFLHANQFIAAFVAGGTIATLAPEVSGSFRHTGELISEIAKGAALVVFAASLVDAETLGTTGLLGWLFALLVVAVTRPAPVWVALIGTRLSAKERLSVAWFGPKGFASVAYAVIVAFSGMPGASQVLAFTTVAVLVSIVAHSSTDVSVAKALASEPESARARDGP